MQDVVDQAVRPRAMSLMHWAVNIGTAVAAAIGGYLAGRGFGLLFLLDAVTCLTFAMIVLRGIRRDRPLRTPSQVPANGGYVVVFRDRLMVAFVLLNLLGTLVYTMTEYAIPLAIRLDGLPPTVFGLVAVVNAVGVVLLQPVLYGWLAGMSRVSVLAVSWALLGLGVASTGLAHSAPVYALTAVVWTVGEAANGIVWGGIVADLAPPEARGRYQGAVSWSWAAARLIGPALATGLFTTVGPDALWSTVAVCGVGAAFASLRLTDALRRRTGRR